jgi:hypothetical protein
LPLTYDPVLVNGTYRLRIHEHEAEKSFIDQVELVTVDHPIGFDAGIDMDGNVVLGKDRLLPLSVEDDWGENVLPLLAENDDQKFVRQGSGSLVATFRGRNGARYAMASAGEPKPPCKLWAGPTRPHVAEPFDVKMEVEDARGVWYMLPQGPVRLPVAHARPFIDLSGYDLGGTFRVRYTWDDHLELDEMSIILQDPVDYAVRKVSATTVTHSGDHATGPMALHADGRYAELVTGEYIDLQFPAEPVPEGHERSFILVANGYYITWYGEEEASRPLHFGLNGNYPNPFNPSTTIRYSLAGEATVTLEIFNVLGQKVRTLLAGETQTPGSYEITWDGMDARGRSVGSGAYLYRLTANDFVETRKMIMLK